MLPRTTRLLCMMAAFLVPTSQAVVSNTQFADMNTAGYFCTSSFDVRSISIHYGDNPQGLPCRVNLNKGKNVTQLLEAKRNTEICENKARIMAARMLDRGWHCVSSNISL